MIHMLRRNFDLNILLFNNEIYGLTKGQYSPTSPTGKVTKSTPMGSVDHPFNPLALAAGADGTFIARAMDRDPKHLRSILKDANDHKGASLIEIYQNCNVFNDGAFEVFTDKTTKPNSTVFVEHDKPMIFGENNELGIVLDGAKPHVVNFEEEGISPNDLWIHDKYDEFKSSVLIRCFDDPAIVENSLPRPFGVFYQKERDCYEELLHAQIGRSIEMKGEGNLDDLLKGQNTWDIG